MLKKLSTQLEKMFDQPTQHHLPNEPEAAVTTVTNKSEFQILENNKVLENLSYVFSGESLVDKDIPLLFSHLSAFFEGGFLLEKQQTHGVAILTHAFWMGQKVPCKQLSCRTLHTPPASAFQVLKTPTASLMKHFGLATQTLATETLVAAEDRLVSYLLPVNQRHQIIVTTVLAEPWAKIRIELLQKTLMKINFPT